MLMRIKGVKPITVRRGAKVYRYYRHRKTGAVIKAAFGTAEFAAEIARLDRRAEETEPKPGTLAELIAQYRKAPEFTERAPRTREDYGKVFEYLAPIGDEPLVSIDQPYLYALRDKAFKHRKRRFANYVVQVVRLLLSFARRRGAVDTNECIGVETIPRPKGMKKANRAWSDGEREAVLTAAPIHLRAMIALGMFAALREGDACKIGRAGYDGSAIEAVASKNGEPLWIPAHFRLRTVLADADTARREARDRKAKRRKATAIDPPNLVVNSRGWAWTESGFRASFFALIRRLEAKGAARPGLTFHGLRHTVGRLIVEAGGASKDVAAILGDRSEAMGELYSREFDRRSRTASMIKKLERNERKKMDKRNAASKKHSGRQPCK